MHKYNEQYNSQYEKTGWKKLFHIYSVFENQKNITSQFRFLLYYSREFNFLLENVEGRKNALDYYNNPL